MDAGNGYGPFVIEFPEECRPRAERRILWKLGVYALQLDDDILLLAKEDAMGKALQDLSLKKRERASKKE